MGFSMGEYSLEMSEDVIEVQKWVHEFAENVVRPAAHEWDEKESTPWPIIQEAAKNGLYSLEFYAQQWFEPSGLGIPVVMEELFWGDAGIGLSIVGTTLASVAVLANGTNEQIGEWVPQMFGDENDVKLGSFCSSEPDAGSDVGAIRTRAVYDEAKDEWVINGTKTWATNGGIADVHVVVCSVDPELKTRGHASFVIPPGTKGLSQGQKFQKHGTLGMARRDGRLDLERAGPAAAQRPFQDDGALRDLGLVPERAVLLVQGDQVAVRADPGRAARIVQQHQREHAVRLGLVWHQHRQHPGQADRLPGQPGLLRLPVPLIEEQVQDVEHGGKAFGQQVRRRHAERDARVRDLLLGPEQALAHGRFRHEERAGDLRGAQAGQAPQRQRHLGIEVQRGMAAGEHELQALIRDLAVARVGRHRFHRGHLPQLRRLGRRAAHPVDGPVACRGGEPRQRLIGHPGPRPLLQGLRETRPGHTPRPGPSRRR